VTGQLSALVGRLRAVTDPELAAALIEKLTAMTDAQLAALLVEMRQLTGPAPGASCPHCGATGDPAQSHRDGRGLALLCGSCLWWYADGAEARP
jgi:hypothetical protein